MKQPKKGRLWLNDGSCVRLRPKYHNHVWSYDFMHHRTDDGRAFRTLNILDEHSREYLAIRVKWELNSTEVIDALTDLFIIRGVPVYIRSDNALNLLQRLSGCGSRRLEPRSPTSSRVRPGRMDTARASMNECEINYSTEKCFARSERPKS